MSRENGKLTVKGKTYNIVTLDFETFYSKEYTLSGQQNTSEYIRDARFHAHGISIKEGAGETVWKTREAIRATLEKIDWTTTALLAHNTPFDGFILSEHYQVKPAFYLDTLAMSRATRGAATRHDLDTVAKAFGHAGKVKRDALADTKGKELLTPEEEHHLGEYAVDDAEDTYSIFWDMYAHVPDDELRLIDMTVRMFCDPQLELDTPRVQQELEREVGAKAAALLAAGETAEMFMSNDKFASLLKKHIPELPMKISPSTGRLTYAFARSDAAFKELRDSGSPAVKALCDARVRVKSTIGETRAVRFLEAGKDGKKFPVLLNYAGAHTLRWSGGNKINLQNLVRGGELRRSLLAPKGQVIVVADSAQIEARVLAWLAGQRDIVEAFALRKDVYKLMACGIYLADLEEVTPEQRFVGKVCVLGLGFGMGSLKLRQTLAQGVMGPPVKVSEEEAKHIVDTYRRKNWRIKQCWTDMETIITAMTVGGAGEYGPLSYGKGFIKLPNGLFLQYPGLHGEAIVSRGDLTMTETSYLTRVGRAKLYGGLLTENVVQALARCIVAEQMLKVQDAGYRVVTMTHDEIVFLADENKADEALDCALEIMSTPPAWATGLPLAAEGGWDVNYSK